MSVLDERIVDGGPGDGYGEQIEELEFLLEADPTLGARRAAAHVRAARAERDDDAEMRLSYYLALAHHVQGHDVAALAAAARTEQLALGRGDLAWQSRALACRGMVHHEIGDVEDAVDLLRRAVDLRREAHDDAGTAEVLTSLGRVYIGMSQFAPEAASTLAEARRLWLTAGEPDGASTALTHLATNYVVMSQRIARTNSRGALAAARKALEVAQQAVDEADAAGLSRTAIDARLAVVGAHLVSGDLEAAGVTLRATTTMQTRFPAPRQQLALHRVRAAWLAQTGRCADAIDEVDVGLRMCDVLDRPADRVELLRTRVDALERSGDVVGALGTLHELHDLTVELGEAVAARRAVLLSSRLEVERAERVAEAERRRSSALEARNERLAYEASHDVLTGLANRRALDDDLVARAEGGARPFTLALVDVDHFKRVNDECSHQTGDEVLARLGAVLAASVRPGDLAARYGGEEFALVLDGADREVARGVCDRVRSVVAALDWPHDVPGGRVTVSIGAAARTATTTVDEVLARADAALYLAKADGRNRVQLAD